MAAYRATVYRVAAETPFDIRIGDPCPYLRDAAIITAYNPFGQVRSDRANVRASALLAGLLRSGDYTGVLPTVHIDALGIHPEERGFLVPGIPERIARTLGVRFGQDAIVLIAAGVPELLLLR